MPDRDSLLKRLHAEYDGASDAYLELYGSELPELAAIYSAFHQRINNLLNFMNSKIYGSGGGHFNAEPSREFINLLQELQEVRATLKRVGIVVNIRSDYKKVLEDCEAFLVASGGSTIPDGFGRVTVERYEAVFTTGGAAAPVRPNAERPPLTLVGEGSFALVHRFRDPILDADVALKSARKTLNERELARFRQEYDTLKSLNNPYIVRAYTYDETQPSFTMEYCNTTLHDYIKRNNSRLSWSVRKRIALQFLYGLSYLHRKGVLHRDISLRNVLIQEHDLGVVTVKLSDFGLHKSPESEFTKIDSSMKGTVLDPTLDRFADFAATNDIYAVGHVLSYIFTGRSGLNSATGVLRQVIDKCTDNVVAKRFGDVSEIVDALEALDVPGAATA